MRHSLIYLVMLLNLFSCSKAENHKMPDLPLVSVSYSRGSQMMRYNGTDITVFSRGDSVFAIVFDMEHQKKKLYRVDEPGVMDSLTAIIRDHKMYAYDNYYNNKYVLDGWSWHYEAEFRDNAEPRPNRAYLSSGGSNATPKNSEGLGVLSKKLQAIAKEAELLYACDDEGNEIPDVPLELRHGDHEGYDFIYLMLNDYDGRLDISFHGQDTSAVYRTIYGDKVREKNYFTLKKTSERCYGSKILDDGKHGPVLYLIVDQGGLESVELTELLKDEPRTTRISVTQGLTDVQVVDGVVKGIGKQGEVVDIVWQKIEP